jgi:hypothetical protein
MLVEEKKSEATNSNEMDSDSLELELANIPLLLQGREEELWQWLGSLDANPKPFYEWCAVVFVVR